MRTALVWFRNDLRLADHAALSAAARAAERVIPVYVHAPEEAAPWAPGSASRWWLHHSLGALGAALAAEGSRLILRRGPSGAALCALAAETGASAVFFNRTFEPALAARDAAVEVQLAEAGVASESFAGNLLLEPAALRTQAGGAFRVFTPYWRAWQAALEVSAPPLPRPRLRARGANPPPSLALDALALLPRIRWDAGLTARFQPGEAAALARLERFLDEAVADYTEARDRPDTAGTSRLSAHLHFGELSPRQALAAIRARAPAPGAAARARGAEAFLRQLGWREFAHHVLHHFPHTSEAPMDPRFNGHRWRSDSAGLAAWQRGRTGIPLVDAGMRELWATGWMHNRVRMVVASFLTKNLGLHWLEGARWFHETLVDADLANNTMGWQWTAGSGADAAPYYRIFNPVLQAERFDPDRGYLRRWLPELARLPDEWLHRPFLAPAAVLAAAGVTIGSDYPAPIVDLKRSRERALETWAEGRGTGATPAAPRRNSAGPKR